MIKWNYNEKYMAAVLKINQVRKWNVVILDKTLQNNDEHYNKTLD